jgi:hypothetical protein
MTCHSPPDLLGFAHIYKNINFGEGCRAVFLAVSFTNFRSGTPPKTGF